jgi:hypothetical protein
MSTNVIHLYRQILKKAAVFPSRNRIGIIKEIKHSFRENKTLQDPAKIATSIRLAREGLDQLSMYTSLRDNAGDWTVNLSQEPMPKPSKDR